MADLTNASKQLMSSSAVKVTGSSVPMVQQSLVPRGKGKGKGGGKWVTKGDARDKGAKDKGDEPAPTAPIPSALPAVTLSTDEQIAERKLADRASAIALGSPYKLPDETPLLNLDLRPPLWSALREMGITLNEGELMRYVDDYLDISREKARVKQFRPVADCEASDQGLYIGHNTTATSGGLDFDKRWQHKPPTAKNGYLLLRGGVNHHDQWGKLMANTKETTLPKVRKFYKMDRNSSNSSLIEFQISTCMEDDSLLMRMRRFR